LKLDINPRKISESKKEELKKSIERFNLVDIPVLDKDDVIISGNQRVFILQVLDRGDEYIDVRVPNRKLTIKEKKEYALLANTHAGEFDFDILEAEFGDIDFDNIGFDIGKIKFETSNIFEKTLQKFNDTPVYDEAEKDLFEDEGITANNKFGVITMCESAIEQEEFFNDLTAKGYKCKIVVV